MLSIWLVFFFNIERILFGTDVNLFRSDTYIFVAVVALMTLLLPKLRTGAFAFLLIVATSLFLLVWYYDPSWTRHVSATSRSLNTPTLLTIIQVNAIILTGLLVRQITYDLDEFESVIADITFGHVGSRPQPFAEEQSAMYREIKRARRYERPLAVMALKVDDEAIEAALPQIVKDVQNAMLKEYTLAGIARTLNDNLQGFDIIATWKNHFLVVLPETSAQAVPHIALRLKNAVKSKLGVQLQIGAANLHDQAMTFERLINLAMDNANSDDVAAAPSSSNHNLKHKQHILTREV
jgi:GGDEF domain-containing protein